MRVVITGASGFIGTALSAALTERGDDVVPLRRGQAAPGQPTWDPAAGRIDDGAFDGADAVVHLAGESILPPWTAAKKRRIHDSRTVGTDLVARAVAEAGTPVLLGVSGIDFYGDRGDDVLTEEEPQGSSFMAEVSADTEAATAPARAAGTRVVAMRPSLVLHGSGGSLPKMMIPFRLFVGGPIGSGRQYWSSISLHDMVRGVLHCLDTDAIDGPVNMTSPEPVRNRDFAKALGAAMHRPAVFPTPAFAVKTVLGAEAAQSLLLESKRVVPSVLEATGFAFAHPTLESILTAALA